MLECEVEGEVKAAARAFESQAFKNFTAAGERIRGES